MASPVTRPSGPRRPPPRLLEVVTVERITSRLVSVVLGGEALSGFREPLPTAHIKLFLPDRAGRLAMPVTGSDGLVWPEGRPPMRTYTPRRFDAAADQLEVQFVLHGEGLAAQWAAQASPGDRVAIGGPGGGLTPDPGIPRWWIAVDESALPAAAMLIEALPEGARAEVHLEVEHAGDHAGLPTRPGVTVVWHDRNTAPGGDPEWGAPLLDAAREAELDGQTQVWAAGEAQAVRRIRTHLLTDRAHPRPLLTTRGYWRLGESDHSDHDHGED